MERFVIKAQRALHPKDSNILIKSEDGSVFQEMPAAGALDTAIGDRPKAYFEVSIDDKGIMALHREVRAKW